MVASPRQTPLQQGFHLPQKALFHHGVHPAVYAVIEIRPVKKGQADVIRLIFGRQGTGALIMLRDGLPGLAVNLQCPENALFIPQREPLGAHGIDLHKLPVQLLHTPLRQFRLQPFPRFTAAVTGGDGAAADQRIQIKSRAAH